MSPLVHWLFEWQTLITGVLALGVGGASVLAIRAQIKQQDRLHDDTRQSRFAVAKAKAPLAAIEIHEHAKTYLAQVELLVPLVLANSRQAFTYIGPTFPGQAEVILDALVESTDDSILINQISALYSEQQVMTSRLSDVPRPAELTLAIDDYVLQPIMMDAIAMNLLAFGRDGLAMSPLSWDDVEASAKRLIQDKSTKTRILGHIADRKKRERPVPLALRRHSGGI